MSAFEVAHAPRYQIPGPIQISFGLDSFEHQYFYPRPGSEAIPTSLANFGMTEHQLLL